jgi:hypothetical protein
LNYQQLREKYDIETNFLEYYSLLSAIPRPWATNKRVMVSPVNLIEIISRAQKPSKLIYKCLLEEAATFPDTLIQKWQQELETQDINADMLKKSFKMLYSSSTSTKIRSFQYRLLHRSIGINSKLFEWGIRETNMCDLCKKEVETYIHLFYTCEKTKTIWQTTQEWTRNTTGQILEINPQTAIFGTNSSSVKDLILITTKMYIYYCKISRTEPREETLSRRLEDNKNTEKYIAVKNNKVRKFEEKWNIQQEEQ